MNPEDSVMIILVFQNRDGGVDLRVQVNQGKITTTEAAKNVLAAVSKEIQRDATVIPQRMRGKRVIKGPWTP